MQIYKDPPAPTPAPPSPWLTAEQAAAYTGFTDRTLRDAAKAGELKRSKGRRAVRYHRDELDRWLLSKSSDPSATQGA